MSIKIQRALTKAGIPDMPMVRKHIMQNLEQVGADLDKLSSTELGYIIKALHIGYHDAKGSQQADYMADMDCVWVGGDVQKLIPLQALRDMQITTCAEEPVKPHKPTPYGGWSIGPTVWHRHTYRVEYTERF